MKLTRKAYRDPRTGRTKHRIVRADQKKKTIPKPRRPGVRTSTGLVNEVVAAQILGKSISTLQNRRSKGQPPNYIRQGRRIFYEEAELEAYLASTTKNGTIISD